MIEYTANFLFRNELALMSLVGLTFFVGDGNTGNTHAAKTRSGLKIPHIQPPNFFLANYAARIITHRTHLGTSVMSDFLDRDISPTRPFRWGCVLPSSTSLPNAQNLPAPARALHVRYQASILVSTEISATSSTMTCPQER